jgi:beta-galactosidase
MTRAPKFAAYAYASQGFSANERPILEPATHWSFGDRKVGGVFPLVILTNCDAVTFHYGHDEPLMFLPAFSRFPHLRHPPVIIEATDIPEDERIVWGQRWRDGLFAGLIGDETVIERYFVANPLPTTLDVQVKPLIRPQDAYHDRPVQVTVRDQVGNRLPYFMDQLSLAVDGPAILQGPPTTPIIGGVGGFWVRVLGDEPVTVSLQTASGRFAPQSITLDA